MVVLLTLRADCSLVTLKPAHLSPYLPVTTPSGSLYRVSSVVMGSFITRTPFNRSVSPSRRGECTMVIALKSGSTALFVKLACLLLPRICCQKGPTLHFTYSSIARYPPAREEGASGRFFSGASSVIRNDQHPIMLSRSTFKPPIVLKGMKNTLT